MARASRPAMPPSIPERSVLSWLAASCAEEQHSPLSKPVGGQVVPSTDSGHAFLHDFCVAIPYGCVMGALAAVAYFQHAGSIATTLLAAAVSALSLTYLSLQNWRAKKPCRPYTLLTAGAALAATLGSSCSSALLS